MKVSRKVFDAHFHIGLWGTRTVFGREVHPLGPVDPQGYVPGGEHADGEACERYLDEYGLAGGIILCNYLATDPRYSLIDLNHLVYEVACSTPRLYAAIFVSPKPEDMQWTREALSLFDHPKVAAMKFTSTHWAPNNPDPATWSKPFRDNMEELVAFAASRRIPIHFHTGSINSEPKDFDRFLAEYGKDLRVHFAHSGESVYPSMQFVPLFREWLEAGLDVYGDTSMCPGFVIPWLLREIAGIPGGDRHVLFATDSPWGVFPSDYWKVECLRISDELKNKIFYENAAELYRLPA